MVFRWLFPITFSPFFIFFDRLAKVHSFHRFNAKLRVKWTFTNLFAIVRQFRTVKCDRLWTNQTNARIQLNRHFYWDLSLNSHWNVNTAFGKRWISVCFNFSGIFFLLLFIEFQVWDAIGCCCFQLCRQLMVVI